MTVTPLVVLLVVVAIGCLVNVIYRLADKREKIAFCAFMGLCWAAVDALALAYPHDLPHNAVIGLAACTIIILASCIWLVLFNAFHVVHHYRDRVAAATSGVMIPVSLLVLAHLYGWSVPVQVLLVFLLAGIAIGAIFVIYREFNPTAGHHGHH